MSGESAETATAPETPAWSAESREREWLLLRKLALTTADEPEHQAAREELVRMNLPLVQHLARRFRNRGEANADLVQVGTIGLIKAIDRFDPERGVQFSTYATPTIIGEIKRHFRDRGWSIRVPRRLQELRMQINAATSELTNRTGRSPTIKEIAAFLEVEEDDILEGIESLQAYAPLSLDSTFGNEDDGAAIGDSLGDVDEALEGVEYRESLKPLLAELSERERQIILLRFFKNKTQAEIATEVGISQMHVSRLLAKSLAQLRSGLLTED